MKLNPPTALSAEKKKEIEQSKKLTPKPIQTRVKDPFDKRFVLAWYRINTLWGS